MKTLTKLALAALALAPAAALAQTGINTSAIQPYTEGIIKVINYYLVPTLMALAFIVFLWGVYKYFIQGASNESEKGEGRKFAMWGIIGFVIILSLWGIINLLMSTFGLSVGSAPAFPTIGGSPYSPATGGSANNQPSAATVSALNQSYAQMQAACGSSLTSSACQSAQTAYQNAFNNAYQGASTVNAGLGNPTVSPAQQQTATNEYQTCMSSGGTGTQCQNVYACALNGGSLDQCMSSNSVTPASATCDNAYADNYGSAGTCTFSQAMTNCSNSGWVWDLNTDTCNEPAASSGSSGGGLSAGSSCTSDSDCASGLMCVYDSYYEDSICQEPGI